MRERNTIAYEVVGVAPVGSERTSIQVIARNTTPLRAGMVPDSYDTERRRDGTKYRLSFVKRSSEWKVEQIEEWQDYGSGGQWRQEFKRSDLEPMVPSTVMIRPF
ncbi:hypothetical protein OMW55_11715 [Sphingomonas sp. BN140010]|uniref:Uncharacterized protein n=1 Tax=Sphingomonas arvum TaxID=2992113 RepID=A0ABT3JHB6_9SPHN|nr:hypothetical protein [Sphingomonas sp. BN140010]MCW3798472.1 hypothetical protein [Sphingomonas sp. BN140010]